MSSHDRHDSERSALERLSRREREVLRLVVEGNTSKEIGALLHLSPKTVATYRCRAVLKLKLRLEIEDLPGLVKFAIRNGLTTL